MPHSSVLQGLLNVCVLAALVFNTVDSYNCTRCSVNRCYATQTLCETSQSCFSYQQELYLSGQPLAFVEEKGCSESLCASLSFSATLGSNRTFRYGHHCCQTELCNQGDFQVPQQSLVPNGIRCPACYNENDMSCDPVLLTCTGTETKCVTVTGSDKQLLEMDTTTSSPGDGYHSLEADHHVQQGVAPFQDRATVKIFAKGCATETGCNLKNINVLDGVAIHTHCVDQRGASPPLLPTASSLLIALTLIQGLI